MKCLGSGEFAENVTVERTAGRVEYIDALKGVAIFLVVLGHIVTNDEDFHRLFNFIYSFHMPLFMFLSGCTTALSYGRSTGTDGAYLRKRFVNIMAPYFAWAVLLPLLFTRPLNRAAWFSILQKTFVTNRMFWFLPTLYGLIIAYVCYRRIRDRLRNRLEWYSENAKAGFVLDSISCVIVVAVITAFMLLTGYQLFRDIVGFTIPFFSAVIYMENEWVHSLFHKRASFAAALVIYVLLIGRFDFNRIAVTTSLLRMLLGMCAVVVLQLVFLKQQIPRIINSQLTLWGRYSLLIYILHAQIAGISRRLTINFQNRAVTLLWYCLVSILSCYICSALAAVLEHIPMVRTVLFGKKGDCYVNK